MLNNNTVLTNQKEILDQIKIFYAHLYENKEKNLKDCDWNTFNNQQNTLTPDEALNIEGPHNYHRNRRCTKGFLRE